ncbi:YjgF family translation initiation inhibitor [Pseudomonas saudiphocaensis]|uniref:YjgF family translation initiation inhibitor n=1 Tax=Pseudomonas saudiphocaensis TaxID=1499686 RepID=A0A078LVX7_9PSED|nr:YjgF family translation initiation inhibitor [Pseudomonas saudiphocaensis]
MHNLCTAIAAVGGTPQQIAKLTVLIVNHSEARLQVFGEELERAPGSGPACTLIPVPRLALEGMLFEVEAVVLLAEGQGLLPFRRECRNPPSPPRAKWQTTLASVMPCAGSARSWHFLRKSAAETHLL